VGLLAAYTGVNMRVAGFISYDLGVKTKFQIQSPEIAQALDLEMNRLSRIRTGALLDFLVTKSLGVFAVADFAVGSFSTSEGILNSRNQETKAKEELLVLGGKQKLSALSFGLGLAYFAEPFSKN